MTKYYYYHTFSFRVYSESSIRYDEINRHLLSTFNGPHTELGAGGAATNKSDTVPALPELIFHRRRPILV